MEKNIGLCLALANAITEKLWVCGLLTFEETKNIYVRNKEIFLSAGCKKGVGLAFPADKTVN